MWKSQFGLNWSQPSLLQWGGDVMRVFDWESECRLSDWHTCLSAHRPGFHSVFKCILSDFIFPLIGISVNHHRLMFLASVLHLWKSEVNLYLLGCVKCLQILKINSTFDWTSKILLLLVEQQHRNSAICLFADWWRTGEAVTIVKEMKSYFNLLKPLNISIRQSFMLL